MRLILKREIPEDQNLRRQWNEMAFQMERPEVFYTWEWAFAMQAAYGAVLQPMLYLAYEGDELVGVASLATDPEVREVRFLAATTSDYCDFVSAPSQRRPLVDAVIAELRKAGARSLVLASIPEDSSSVAGIRSAARAIGYHALVRRAQVCFLVRLGVGEERQQLQSDLVSKRGVRRNLRAMEAIGPVAVEHLRSWGDIEPALPRFVACHVGRFLSTGRTSNLVRPERQRFLEELARKLSAPGWLVLSRLSVNDSPVAWNYGFSFCGSWFWYQPTFETSAGRYAPGLVLLSKIVAEACKTADTELVDLGVGSELYKGRFANGERRTLDFTLNQQARHHLRVSVRQAAASTIKKSPRLESVLRRVMQRLASGRRSSEETGARGLVGWAGKGLWNRVFSLVEIFFYEWTGSSSMKRDTQGLELKLMDPDVLTESAMTYADDAETMSYLYRAAQRREREEGLGFVLCRSGKPVHFSWVCEFEGFYMQELNAQLHAPVGNAVMIFDCWTPAAVRGSGYYGITTSWVAQRLLDEGKAPWIFSAAQNVSSVHGIERAGFQRRYSMIRRKVLLWQDLQTLHAPASTAEETMVSSTRARDSK